MSSFQDKDTLEEVLAVGRLLLKNAGIESFHTDARVLLEHVTGLSRTDLVVRHQENLSQKSQTDYDQLLARRCRGEPVAKIIECKEFWGRLFKTTAATLDPRPDSETLIQGVFDSYANQDAPKRILDLGTGTGCLLLTLLHAYPRAHGLGIDASPDALKIAQENARAHALETRAHFKVSNWFQAVEGAFDLIISNPPYIDPATKSSLSQETLHDPESALFAAEKGLADYQNIAQKVSAFMTPGARLFLEIGYDQARAVTAIFTAAGLSFTALLQDLEGRDRVLCFQKD